MLKSSIKNKTSFYLDFLIQRAPVVKTKPIYFCKIKMLLNYKYMTLETEFHSPAFKKHTKTNDLQ